MENSYLIGNEIIEQALTAVNEAANYDTVMALVHAIQQRMADAGHFLLPVEYPDPDDPFTFLTRSVPNDDGELYMACFTCEEELRKGEDTAVVSYFIDRFIEAAIDSDAAAGIIINPFGNAYRLSKGVLQIVMEAKKPAEDDYIRENKLFEKAIHFAVTKHAGQLRKGTTTPYIVHPLETMAILRDMHADTNLLIAGLLHDTVEDTDTTTMEIAEIFGTDVASLVQGHSEDKSRTWKQRKAHAVKELAEANKRMKMLVMADKVANLRNMLADLKTLGDDLWARFNAPREMIAWYYSGIQDALWDMQFDPYAAPAYWEMVALYKDVFVTFYQASPAPNHSEDYLLQVDASGKAYLLKKGYPEWKKVRDYQQLIAKGCTELARKDAEAIEDSWNMPFWECVEQDLQPSAYDLISTEDRMVKIDIISGKLTLSGEDHGAACEVISGSDEYEYRIKLDEDNTKKLIVQLRIKHGTEAGLESIFSKEFGCTMPSTKLMNFCERKKILYDFSSY